MIAATWAAVLAVAVGSERSTSTVPNISSTAAAYLLNCGGCHGIEGRSSDAAVPSLRGQADAFLCLPEGREYIVRLPNVSFAPLTDAQLADLMNYVVAFGQTRVGKGDPPYTAEEVGTLRKNPLKGQAIAEYRRRLVRTLIKTCGAPRALLRYP